MMRIRIESRGDNVGDLHETCNGKNDFLEMHSFVRTGFGCNVNEVIERTPSVLVFDTDTVFYVEEEDGGERDVSVVDLLNEWFASLDIKAIAMAG